LKGTDLIKTAGEKLKLHGQPLIFLNCVNVLRKLDSAAEVRCEKDDIEITHTDERDHWRRSNVI